MLWRELVDLGLRILNSRGADSKKHQPGTVLELSPDQFKHAPAVSPHYGGLPEVLKLAEYLKVKFPTEIRILAMEIEPPYVLREGLNPIISDAFPQFVKKAGSILKKWGVESTTH